MQFTPQNVDMSKPAACIAEAIRMLEVFGKGKPFLSVSDSGVKRATLGQSPRQIPSTRHGRKGGQAKAFATQIPFEQLQGIQD